MRAEPGASSSIRVFDSLRREVVPLPLSSDPGQPGWKRLSLYVCGVTPYDSGHLGHAFTFCVFDVLARWVSASGFPVRYVQNVTDVDDPLFERARRLNVNWRALADRETDHLVAQMDALGWRRPDVMPRVSEEIPSILSAIDGLAAGGYGYQAGSYYFEASRYPGFGGLSHRSRRSMLAKLRDEGLLEPVGPGAKRDALDFPLWRPSRPDEPAWPSMYGLGRPGWHIECSAMAMRHLGPQVDVHGGGRDLAFSHHESERAQSESLTGLVPFAGAWMHAGMVRYDGHKMSKSRGNLVVVEETLERASAAAVRLYLASHHYRRDWSFRWEGLARAARLASRLAALLQHGGGGGGGAGPQGGLSIGAGAHGGARDLAEAVGIGLNQGDPELIAEFSAALDDDLDTPRAVRALRAAVRRRDARAAGWMGSILCGSASFG
ncbi:MAG: class I tRNA ligase family protein [Candidatus Dormibacteraeota bacterium]|nr:class I tRNA ligase family protein [Candidatus Dormibacteraeota bacterium]